MTNKQRRTARGATRPAPGPRRRPAQSHDRVTGRARANTGRKPQTRKASAKRVPVNATRPVQQKPSILKSLTKLTARAVVAIIILAIFVFGVFPTGSYIEQRNELKDAESELAELEADNVELESLVNRLESDEEIERVAREDFGMGRSDEESLLILPPGN